MSLKYIKENYGDRICLVGNVDPGILEFGKPEDVAMEVERFLREGGFKGYISLLNKMLWLAFLDGCFRAEAAS